MTVGISGVRLVEAGVAFRFVIAPRVFDITATTPSVRATINRVKKRSLETKAIGTLIITPRPLFGIALHKGSPFNYLSWPLDVLVEWLMLADGAFALVRERSNLIYYDRSPETLSVLTWREYTGSRTATGIYSPFGGRIPMR